jgi:hypothetical protein
VKPTDKLIYDAIKIGIVLIPSLLGAYMFIAACIGYGKPPAKPRVRVIVASIGLLLIVLSIRNGFSK